MGARQGEAYGRDPREDKERAADMAAARERINELGEMLRWEDAHKNDPDYEWPSYEAEAAPRPLALHELPPALRRWVGRAVRRMDQTPGAPKMLILAEKRQVRGRPGTVALAFIRVASVMTPRNVAVLHEGWAVVGRWLVPWPRKSPLREVRRGVKFLGAEEWRDGHRVGDGGLTEEEMGEALWRL